MALNHEMNVHVMDLVERFAAVNVLVVGDAILDGYLRGSATRLCREAPAPVVDVDHRFYVPGGAANAAHNVRSLGGQVQFLSTIGDDLEGDLLRHALEASGTATNLLVQSSDRQTLSKQRLVADGQVLVRFDLGSTTPLTGDTEVQFLTRLESAFAHADVVLISDYAYGTMTDRVLRRLGELQSSSPRVLVVDARELSRYRALAPTAVKPNYAEAVAVLSNGRTPTWAAPPPRERVRWLEPAGDRLLELTGAKICAVTLDVDGALAFERDRPPYRAYARPARATQSTGAGDSFAAALALALASGADTATAIEVASAAADRVVERDGTVACSSQDLRRALSRAPNGPSTRCRTARTSLPPSPVWTTWFRSTSRLRSS